MIGRLRPGSLQVFSQFLSQFISQYGGICMQGKRFWEFGAFRLDVGKMRLIRDGQIIQLPPKAVGVLHLLLQRAGQVTEKEELFTTVWPGITVEESNLTQTVYLLRKTLSQQDDTQNFIETIPRVGYRFNGQVREVFESETKAIALSPRLSTAVVPENQPEQPGLKTDQISDMALGEMAGTPTTLWRRGGVKIGLVVSAMILVAAVAVGIWLAGKGRGHAVHSIAVLPFAELGADTADSALGLGIADTVITRLGSLDKIEVRPTAAVQRYNNTQIDAIEVGRQLGVDAVLSGRIHRVGDGQTAKMRVTAQLLDVATGKTILAKTFDLQPSDLFTLEDSLAQQVAASLKLDLTGADWQRLKKNYTDNLEAHQLYLKGRLFWNRRQPEWIKKGIECFEEATRLDPNYALAYAGIADSYALTSSGMPGLERMPKAKAAALKALELDNELAEAHASLGFIKYKFDYDWSGAEASLRRAIGLNPNYATAHHWYGECLSLMARPDESLAELQRAEKLDPLSLPIKQDIGESLYRARRYDRAITKFREVLELEPSFARVRRSMYMTYQAMGRHDDAVNERLTQVSQWKMAPESLAALKQAYQESGWQGYWRKELELMEAKKMGGSGETVLAQRHIYLGDKERAFPLMEKSFAERSGIALQLKADPEFDSLRSDPRFQEMLRRAGHLR
jgi:DNA-binding winged helix-turn-helix (wHTH) protein/TolB-like protein/lipopolysaccharide biosynthesis regulator YciM